MFLKNSFLVVIFYLLSCQPLEIMKPVEIDNSIFENISINAQLIEINDNYESVFSKENIEDQILQSPIKILKKWINQNIIKFGNENKFVVNILDASISKKEIENADAKKYEEKTIFQYEVFFLVEYQLYDDSNFLIANTTVESSRSTTSQKYISLNEADIIINEMLINAMHDFTKETKLLLLSYMGGYLGS